MCSTVFLNNTNYLFLGENIKTYCGACYLTIWHTNRERILEPSPWKERCVTCTQYHDSYLWSKARHILKHTQVASIASCCSSSHVNMRYLDTPKRAQRNQMYENLKLCRQVNSLKDISACSYWNPFTGRSSGWHYKPSAKVQQYKCGQETRDGIYITGM